VATVDSLVDAIGVPSVQGPLVRVIVLVWNDVEDTLECLTSLAEQTCRNVQIVVVDNGSEPPLEPTRFEFWPNVRTVRNKRNLGYAGGNNVALRSAVAEGVDYVFLANNDTIFEPHMLERLITAAEGDPKIAAAGPTVLFYSDPDVVESRGRLIDRCTAVETVRDRGLSRRCGDLATARVDFLVGCGLLIRASALRRVGVLDERFFLNYEETDLCCRIADAGLRVVCVPAAEMWHKVGRSFDKSPSWLSRYYMQRNRWLFLWKRGRRGKAWVSAWRALILGWELTIHHWRRGQSIPANILVHRCAAEHFLRRRFGRVPAGLGRYLQRMAETE